MNSPSTARSINAPYAPYQTVPQPDTTSLNRPSCPMNDASPAYFKPSFTPGVEAMYAPGCRQRLLPWSSITPMSPGVGCTSVTRRGPSVLFLNSLMKSDSPPRYFLQRPEKNPPLNFAVISRSADMLDIASDSAMTLSPGSRSTCMWAKAGRPSMVVFILFCRSQVLCPLTGEASPGGCL